MQDKLQINLRDAETLNCENPECDSALFVEVFAFKKVSKFVTGSSQDALVPFPMYKCDKCGHINSEFAMPE